jgi:hypothetical protein
MLETGINNRFSPVAGIVNSVSQGPGFLSLLLSMTGVTALPLSRD